ncbi:MAG: DUF4112 domain-containing protein [Acidobacteria bacterium]|nr:DUF4112 domain-containing protein [Acidobacteriota bacterium]
MAEQVEPEIIPPGAEPRATRSTLTDEQLDELASWLDEVFRVPGTNVRFGLDALAGLLPGIGDLLTGMASMLILHAAWQRGLPRVALLRMLVNIALDTVVGSIPLAGDLFDVAWKANRRNVELLQKYSAGSERRHAQEDYGFLALLLLATLALLALPVVVLVLLYRMVRG